MKSNKAQGAIEYLLMIGASILVVAVVIIAISGVLTQATEETEHTNTIKPLKDLLNLSVDPKETTNLLFEEYQIRDIKIQGISFSN